MESGQPRQFPRAWNVAGLICVGPADQPILDGYKTFLTKNAKALQGVNQRLDREYQKEYSNRSQAIAARERWLTMVYNYFASREVLLTALLQREQADHDDRRRQRWLPHGRGLLHMVGHAEPVGARLLPRWLRQMRLRRESALPTYMRCPLRYQA